MATTCKIIDVKVQRDGRKEVIEEFTDDEGNIHTICRLAGVEEDLEACAEARAIEIDEQLKAKAVEQAIVDLEEPERATREDFLARLVEEYNKAEGFEVARLATYLQGLTQDELTEFNLNENKLQGEATLYNQIIELRGA